MNVVQTARLTLRPFTLDDADALFDLMSRPEVAHWSGRGVPMVERPEAVDRIKRMPLRRGDHPAADVFAVVPHDAEAPVGMADLGLRHDWYDRELRAFRLERP